MVVFVLTTKFIIFLSMPKYNDNKSQSNLPITINTYYFRCFINESNVRFKFLSSIL